jgi:hypothetical protein
VALVFYIGVGLARGNCVDIASFFAVSKRHGLKTRATVALSLNVSPRGGRGVIDR